MGGTIKEIKSLCFDLDSEAWIYHQDRFWKLGGPGLFPKLSDYDVRIKRISKAKVNIDYIYGSAMQGEKEAMKDLENRSRF